MHIRSVTFQVDRYPTDEHYPFNLPVLRQTPGLNLDRPITFFVGENGSGKSTLLEAMAVRCGIYIWRGEQRGRFKPNPHEGKLHLCLRVDWADGRTPGSFFSAEMFRHFSQVLDELASMDPGQLEYFGGASLMTQSHGQSLMSYFRSRYVRPGLYLLDEPESALSPKRQVELLELLNELAARGEAQFIIATHSPILLAAEAARIYSFDHAPIRPIDYADTEHFQVYRAFLNER